MERFVSVAARQVVLTNPTGLVAAVVGVVSKATGPVVVFPGRTVLVLTFEAV